MTKKYNPILIEDYGVVIDENSNNNATKGLNYNFGTKRFETLTYDYDKFTSEWKFCKKIIGSIGKRLDGVPLIELVDDVKNTFKILKEELKVNRWREYFPETESAVVCMSFLFRMILKLEKIYKANTNKYSEEDMHNAFDAARQEKDWSDAAAGDICYEFETSSNYLQSLQKQPIPTEVELGIEYSNDNETWFESEEESEIFKYHRFKHHNKETNTITAVNAK